MYHHLETTKKQFIGKTLENISRVNDATVLIKFGDGTKCNLSVEGDCCSTSIFYEIEMPEILRGAILKDIIEHDEKDVDSQDTALEKVKASGIDFYLDESKVWNVVLKTNRGNALVRHINSSNGYYDGYTRYEFVD
jgi:hypothetical protein